MASARAREREAQQKGDDQTQELQRKLRRIEKSAPCLTPLRDDLLQSARATQSDATRAPFLAANCSWHFSAAARSYSGAA